MSCVGRSRRRTTRSSSRRGRSVLCRFRAARAVRRRFHSRAVRRRFRACAVRCRFRARAVRCRFRRGRPAGARSGGGGFRDARRGILPLLDCSKASLPASVPSLTLDAPPATTPAPGDGDVRSEAAGTGTSGRKRQARGCQVGGGSRGRRVGGGGRARNGVRAARREAGGGGGRGGRFLPLQGGRRPLPDGGAGAVFAGLAGTLEN
jgi:hypothetical protein